MSPIRRAGSHIPAGRSLLQANWLVAARRGAVPPVGGGPGPDSSPGTLAPGEPGCAPPWDPDMARVGIRGGRRWRQ